MWTDEEHSTPPSAEVRVGIEQIGSAVQSNDGLSRTRTTLDDECTAGACADDRVLIGLDGAEYVSHLGRAAVTQAGNEGG